MPESDRFELMFRAGWRSAYRDARSGDATDEEVSDKLVTHLCKTMRDQGGIPGFLELVRELTTQDSSSLSERFKAIDRIVKTQAGHRHTANAAEAAKSTLILRAAGVGDSEHMPVAHRFAIQACKGLIEHYFFANARINLVAERILDSESAAYEWQSGIDELLRSRVGYVAAKLCEKPDAKGLRAPNRTVRRKSTSSLLTHDLLSSEPAWQVAPLQSERHELSIQP